MYKERQRERKEGKTGQIKLKGKADIEIDRKVRAKERE
jgi:hypothetical protein